jgi:GTP-binding protein
LNSVENAGTNTIRLEFEIPTRGLIGYRSEFMTDTHGLGIMASRFVRYGQWRGKIVSRTKGSVVSIETGPATAYALEGLQERTVIFVDPTERIYVGQIIGENSRSMDITCNPTKRKHLTNHRSSTKDIGVKLDVPFKMTLEQAMEWIRDDELIEVTPKTIRIRKATLDSHERKRLVKKQLIMSENANLLQSRPSA